MGRRRQRVRRLHVQLRPDDPRLQPSRGRGRRRRPAGQGRHPARARRRHGRAGRTAGRRVEHADWAIFAKNGTDATTLCAHGRARRTRAAARSWPPRAPITAPRPGPTSASTASPPEDRANLPLLHVQRPGQRRAGDRRSRGGGDRRRSSSRPFKHDAGFDQELVDPAFARRLARAVRRDSARRS